MVDEYLGCTRKDENSNSACDGVMSRAGADARSKRVRFVCSKCGNTVEYIRSSYDGGRHVYILPKPNDPLRGPQ